MTRHSVPGSALVAILRMQAVEVPRKRRWFWMLAALLAWFGMDGMRG